MLVLFVVLLFLSFACEANAAEEERVALSLAEIEEFYFFRQPATILWTFQGQGSKSYAVEVRYGFSTEIVLPDFFGKLGLAPTMVMGDILYESNPSGLEGGVIWSKAMAFYDDVFGYDWLEGRGVYEDEFVGSYLGAGIGFVPFDNSWVGAYYFGGDGWKISSEGAYELTDECWVYGIYDYYIDGELGADWGDGQVGARIKIQDVSFLFLEAENRAADWFFKVGVSYILE